MLWCCSGAMAGKTHTLSAMLVEARWELLMELGAGCGTASIQQVRLQGTRVVQSSSNVI